MLLHIWRFGSGRDHWLLLCAGDTTIAMRRVVPARILWLVRAPGLDFVVDWDMILVSTATSAPRQAPATESQEKGNEQSANHGADDGHNQGGVIDARVMGSGSR